MQREKLEIRSPENIIKLLDDTFKVLPLVPRDCVRALNALVYNMQHMSFDSELFKQVIFLMLRGFTCKDQYLKNYIYVILVDISKKSSDGILSINSLLKDLDDKNIASSMKNTALRALFSSLPVSMRFDFEKYARSAVMSDKTRDNAVVILSEYFRDASNLTISNKSDDTIKDYHLSFFNQLPVNQYSCMIEIPRLINDGSSTHGDINSVAQYIRADAKSTIFFEAAKCFCRIKPEISAPFIDKLVSILKMYLKKGEAEVFLSMKILSELSISFPTKVSKANKEIEDLVHSKSKSISMFAILTLLKTGTEETVKKLAEKLEPYMQNMSHSYKIMAIDIMEKLAKSSKKEFIGFLKKAMTDKGELQFKQYILSKFEKMLAREESVDEITDFLCSYLEDPEHYHISMDILGILGNSLRNPKNLIHIYNRLILDNSHVRNAAIQALYDLDSKMDTFETIKSMKDHEILRMREFLLERKDLKRGPFDMEELGDLKGDVLMYLDHKEEEAQLESPLIKECREILLTKSSDDFKVSIIKKIFNTGVTLLVQVENKMDKVDLSTGMIAFESDRFETKIKFEKSDFADGQKKAVKEIEFDAEIGDVINGVFAYEICMEDDVENDSISLEPFNFTILDFTRPVQVLTVPSNMREVVLTLDCKTIEAASKIISMANLFLIADKDCFEMSGNYNGVDIVINGDMKYSKFTKVNLAVHCDDDEVLNEIVSIFE